jgi:hypothetical protein
MRGRLNFWSLELQTVFALGKASYEGQVNRGAVVGRSENLPGLRQVLEVSQLEGVAFAPKCFVHRGEGFRGRLVFLA